MRTVLSAQQEVTADWMQTPGVLGTAVGLGADGNPALVVYVDRDDANAGEIVRSFPAQTRGAGVRVELTDKFRYGGWSEKGHTAKQTPPIPLGLPAAGPMTSRMASARRHVRRAGQHWGAQHILSNYHVFEADTVDRR